MTRQRKASFRALQGIEHAWAQACEVRFEVDEMNGKMGWEGMRQHGGFTAW